MSTDPLDNDGRAGFAATALAAYHDETRSYPETYGDEGSEEFTQTFGDLLGDLQHLAKRAGVDFQELLAQGTNHFEIEVEEEEQVAREAQEREALKNGPVDEQVYAAVTDDFQHFTRVRATLGIPVSEVRWALLRLREQGKVEQVSGKGWRRVSAEEQATEEAVAYEEAFNG